jgi:FMN-dependent oxidoreductase (nitrilotriacetate monooxygenase family)
MAVALERAKFDLIMLGDSLAVPGTYRGRMDAYLRYAEHAPFHDPGPLVAIMAAATRRIGLAATLSTTFYPPFLLARLMTTLDHLSRGRIAWNVVTSYKIEEALNFGYEELLDHDQRYDRADEYMELCYRLWSSWDPDAVVMDQRTDTFADPAKVRAIDFEGTYYRSRGPLNATPSPQGRPVIIQAGASDRGQDFAARHAEAIIVSREAVDEMKQYYDAFKARVKKQGRDPNECKVFFLTKPIIGDTDEAAQRRADELYANAPVDAGLASLSTMLQMDLTRPPITPARPWAHAEAGGRLADQEASKRALYALVGNKQEMLVACIREGAKRLRVPADLPEPRDRESLTRALTIFGTRLLREISDPTVIAVFRLAIAEAVRAPAVAQALDSIGVETSRAALSEIMTRAQSFGLLSGRPAEMAGRFAGLLWGNLMVGLLLRVAQRPSAREITRRARAATAAFLQLYPQPDEAGTSRAG